MVVLSMIGWAVLPNLFTGIIQNIYYGITIRAGDRKPVRGTAQFGSDRRIIHMLVIAAYLFYTIFEAYYEVRKDSNFYHDLGLPFSAGEREIKSRFRRMATQFHPDKAGVGQEAGQYFIHLKIASDTLQNAPIRFAYERFGNVVLQWHKCVTIKDFVSRGLLAGTLPYYAVAIAAMSGFGMLGYLTMGTFYRWLILLSLLVFELNVIIHPTFPRALRVLNAVLTRVTTQPALLPFQIISLLRKLTATMYIALNQIGPVLKVHLSGGLDTSTNDEKTTQELISKLETFIKQANVDVDRLVEMELAPYKGDPQAQNNLQGKMREWLVQNTIRADPMVKDALGTEFQKRRMNAPHGARGTR